MWGDPSVVSVGWLLWSGPAEHRGGLVGLTPTACEAITSFSMQGGGQALPVHSHAQYWRLRPQTGDGLSQPYPECCSPAKAAVVQQVWPALVWLWGGGAPGH